ncbi:hypothetical protein DUT91_23705 [Phyllobacterium salinisoli]|uniref:Uncharacterized protein n=1 Tax=Phyllobacterium salinisoli TaxID=1899321 RepID=A0A368JZ62_9HYPH|nr:hypothetical protein DUT91_23705 [Phyllobacterium salinisoli]
MPVKALKRSDGAKGGLPAYDPVMFKIMVLQALRDGFLRCLAECYRPEICPGYTMTFSVDAMILSKYRGRDAHCWAPPAQIRTSGERTSSLSAPAARARRM